MTDQHDDEQDDDYTLSRPTGEMLRIWREGSEAMKTTPDHSGGGDQIEALIAHIGRLDDREKGQTIIDLMVLLDAMEQAVTEMQLRGVAAASGIKPE